MVQLEGLGKTKKFSDLIRTRTPNFLACSIVPQPSTLPCAPYVCKKLLKLSSHTFHFEVSNYEDNLFLVYSHNIIYRLYKRNCSSCFIFKIKNV
jgi:hypothetical protein